MIEKEYNMPTTVDEAVDIIESDLTMAELMTFASLDSDDYYHMCEVLVPHIIEDFKIWLGNYQLVNSCFENISLEENTDPAQIIMDRLREKLDESTSFVIILE